MILYATLETAIAVIGQQSGEWKADLHVADSRPTCIAQDPLHPDRIYCGTSDQGLWYSPDAGATWKHVDDGITERYITSVAVSPVERVNGYGVVYVGTEPSTIFRSEDGGESWRELATLKQLPSAPTWSFPPKPYTSHVRWITPDPLVQGRIFAAIEAGALIRSQDGGQSWEDRQPDGPFDTHTLIMHRLAPDTLYSAAGDGFMQPGAGFVESHDGGTTWSRTGAGMGHHYLWSVAADPADPSTLLVSGASGPDTAHNIARAESAIYRRTKDGPWQQVSTGLPPSRGMLASVLATNEREPGVFYAANNVGIFRSSDTGLTWEQLPIHWPDTLRSGQRISALVVSQH